MFKLDTAGKETTLHRFNYVDGETPTDLIRDAAGNLYGTTVYGGAGKCYLVTRFGKTLVGCGTVFKLDTTGNQTVLYSFGGFPTDGANPYDALVQDAAGNLYGTGSHGGSNGCPTRGLGLSGCGVVFKLDTTDRETVLYNFNVTGSAGVYPYAGLVRDPAGDVYGTTDGFFGRVFKLDATGKEITLHRFVGYPTDGENPLALIRDAAGNLYGTTSLGGRYGGGVVFKLDLAGKETILYNFGATDGSNPYGALVRDGAGNFYGTFSQGGSYGAGVVFKLDTTGKESILHNFGESPTDGINPYAGLIRDAAGNLYGTTLMGGSSACSYGCGVVFKLTP